MNIQFLEQSGNYVYHVTSHNGGLHFVPCVLRWAVCL